MKNVLIISSSFRKNGNSEAMADAFMKGAGDAGHQVEKINLKGKKLNFCLGCLSCGTRMDGHCVQKDDADDIAQKIKESDVIVLVSPIYYYNISAQLKTVMDRANPIYYVDYKFRDVYLLTAATDDSSDTDRRAVETIGGWVECFDKSRLAGSLFCGGVTETGDIIGNEILNRAYQMGFNV
ncbi:MAG: flavodoxin family protein [Clostridia bacterium]|nr:flavodoxin family protein [Clostridia bacterium]